MGHSGLVARRHHLHRRILQECREATFAKGASLKDRPASSTRVRRKHTPRDRHPRGEEVDESAFKTLVAKRSPSTVLASRNLGRKRSPEGSAPDSPTSLVRRV